MQKKKIKRQWINYHGSIQEPVSGRLKVWSLTNQGPSSSIKTKKLYQIAAAKAAEFRLNCYFLPLNFLLRHPPSGNCHCAFLKGPLYTQSSLPPPLPPKPHGASLHTLIIWNVLMMSSEKQRVMSVYIRFLDVRNSLGKFRRVKKWNATVTCRKACVADVHFQKHAKGTKLLSLRVKTKSKGRGYPFPLLSNFCSPQTPMFAR